MKVFGEEHDVQPHMITPTITDVHDRYCGDCHDIYLIQSQYTKVAAVGRHHKRGGACSLAVRAMSMLNQFYAVSLVDVVLWCHSHLSISSLLDFDRFDIYSHLSTQLAEIQGQTRWRGLLRRSRLGPLLLPSTDRSQMVGPIPWQTGSSAADKTQSFGQPSCGQDIR